MRWLLVTALLAVPTSAAADWQYTRWGMTPAQVVAASNGAVELSSGFGGPERRAGAVAAAGRYDAGEFHFTAEFMFRNGGLTGVSLVETGEACGRLEYALTDKYGDREGRSGTQGLYRWRDPEANTVVEFAPSLAGGVTCNLRYLPISHPGNAGL